MNDKPWSECSREEQWERTRKQGCDLCGRNGIGASCKMTETAAEAGCDVVALGHVSAMGADDPPTIVKWKICRDCRPRFLASLRDFVKRFQTEMTFSRDAPWDESKW